MSWFSSAWDGIKSVGSSIAGVVKKVATPALSFAAGLVPGVGPLLSKGVDVLGNALLGDSADGSSDAGAAAATPVSDLLGMLTGKSAGVGTSEAVRAAANAVATADNSPTVVDDSTASSFLGIGGTSPGVFGIGDKKPGIFGIGTGKSKARATAEADAKAKGQTPAQVKAAGDEAAKGASNTSGGSGESSFNPLLVGAGILAILLL